MVYYFSIKKMPEIKSTYTVIRNTVWQIADTYRILLTVLDGECDMEISDRKYRLSRGN